MARLLSAASCWQRAPPPPARSIPVIGDTPGETPSSAQTEAEREANGGKPLDLETEAAREARGETPTDEGAQAFWHLRLQDEHGEIPDDGYSKAIEHMRQMSAGPTSNSRSRRPDGVDGAGINRNSWTFRGLVGNGGSVISLAIHPQNPQIMLVAAPTGGIHKTTDGGASWRVIDDFMPSVLARTIVFNPANPNIVFSGTSGDTGQGIFRSTNAGDTWEQLPTTAPTVNPNLKYIQRLAMPANGQTVLAATEFILIRSTDNGATWPAVTINAPNARYRAATFHPTDNNRALVATDQGVFYSADAGANWTQSGGTTGVDFAEVGYGPGQRVYALSAVGRGELWRSDDGGQTFTRVYVSTPGTFNVSGDLRLMWVSPIDPNTVIVGGELDMFRTNDGGTNWTKISDWGQEQQRHGHFGTGDPSPHADQQTAVSHPGFNGTTNQTMWVGSHGGVYRTDIAHTAETNRGWIDVNNNLAISQFYGARAITVLETHNEG